MTIIKKYKQLIKTKIFLVATEILFGGSTLTVGIFLSSTGLGLSVQF